MGWGGMTEVTSEMNSSDVSVARGVSGFMCLWLEFQMEASVER